MVTTEIVGPGTDEATWTRWLDRADLPDLELRYEPQRVIVVAAHPDDEVLGVGGLLSRLARRYPILVVWASDGESSHPGSTAISPDRLAEMRREESRRALVRLGVAPAAAHHLGLPDGGLAGCRGLIDVALAGLLTPTDLVLSNWSGDGHPDHEAVGEVVAEVAAGIGAHCLQFPIWMWHWAQPGDDRVPWLSLRQVGDINVTAKAAAVSQFVSQIEAIGPEPADAAVLPPAILARFTRPFEVVFS